MNRCEHCGSKLLQKKLDWHTVKGLDQETWQVWLKWRTFIRKPYKTMGEAKKLGTYPVEVQKEAVAHSIQKEYTGLFPDKFMKKGQPKPDLYRPVYVDQEDEPETPRADDQIAFAQLNQMRGKL